MLCQVARKHAGGFVLRPSQLSGRSNLLSRVSSSAAAPNVEPIEVVLKKPIQRGTHWFLANSWKAGSSAPQSISHLQTHARCGRDWRRMYQLQRCRRR